MMTPISCFTDIQSVWILYLAGQVYFREILSLNHKAPCSQNDGGNLPVFLLKKVGGETEEPRL